MSDAKMPQRWDLVEEYDSYMSPIEEGDWVKAEDVKPLVAEITRLRAENNHLRRVNMGKPSAELHEAALEELHAEIERLRAERDALKAAAREFLTTLGAAMKTGRFHMNGSADMCHFVRQAMQKIDVLAFDREERRPVGLERLHEEAKP